MDSGKINQSSGAHTNTGRLKESDTSETPIVGNSKGADVVSAPGQPLVSQAEDGGVESPRDLTTRDISVGDFASFDFDEDAALKDAFSPESVASFSLEPREAMPLSELFGGGKVFKDPTLSGFDGEWGQEMQLMGKSRQLQNLSGDSGDTVSDELPGTISRYCETADSGTVEETSFTSSEAKKSPSLKEKMKKAWQSFVALFKPSKEVGEAMSSAVGDLIELDVREMKPLGKSVGGYAEMLQENPSGIVRELDERGLHQSLESLQSSCRVATRKNLARCKKELMTLANKGQLPATKGLKTKEAKELMINGALIACKLANPVNGSATEITDRGYIIGKIPDEKIERLKKLLSYTNRDYAISGMDYTEGMSKVDFRREMDKALEGEVARKNTSDAITEAINKKSIIGKLNPEALQEAKKNLKHQKSTEEVRADHLQYRKKYADGIISPELNNQHNEGFGVVLDESKRILGSDSEDVIAVANAVMVASGYAVYADDELQDILPSMHGILDEGQTEKDMKAVADGLMRSLDKGGVKGLKRALRQANPVFNGYELPW